MNKLLADFSYFGIRKTENFTNVLNRSDRSSVHDVHNLNYSIFSILLCQILDNLGTVTDININVRKVFSLNGKESSEVKFILDGIKLRNANQVTYKRTSSRTTTRANNDIIFLTPVDVINQNQKVVTEVFLLNDKQLIINTFSIDFLLFYIKLINATFLPSLFYKVFQISCRIRILWRNLNFWKFRFMPRHIHIITQISNLVSIVNTPFCCIISNLTIKDFMLLFTRHKITSLIDFCGSFRIMCDSKEVILIIKILFGSSMNIVCDDYFCMSIVCQPHDFLIIFCLFTVCVSLNLKIIVRE